MKVRLTPEPLTRTIDQLDFVNGGFDYGTFSRHSAADFSLPSPHGIGTLGREAYDFVDFLCRAGQRWWQILPVGPAGSGDSPYQSISTHAGNPVLIDLEALAEDGLLTREELASAPDGKAGEVDYPG